MIIEKLNGEQIDLKDTPIQLLKFEKSFPRHRFTTQNIDSRDGAIPIDTKLEPRILRGSFYFDSRDVYDYYLQLNKVFQLFTSKEPFYIIHKREPAKRWKVQVKSEFYPEKFANLGRFEIEFISFFPYAESIGTTKDEFTFDSGLWQIGQGLDDTDEMVYNHSTNTFSIYNAGDLTIDPRVVPLVITYNGASTNLSIENKTTGDIWSYTGSTISGDSIKIDGIRTYRNGGSVTRDTNKNVLIIESGTNEFELNGTSGDFTIDFDFRFYYV